MPLNKAPRRSPQANEASTWRSVFCRADFTSGSVSICRRASNTVLVLACVLVLSSLAASSRLVLSALLSKAAARTKPSCSLICAFASAANAFSIRGNLLSSASLCNCLMAAMRVFSSLENSLSAARAESSSPRIRLLIITSSAPSGTGMDAPLTGSNPLPSLSTTKVSPATFTASSESACKNAAVLSSALATALFKASMRASGSPTAIAFSSEIVMAFA